jgi:hypothetical protein
MNKLWKIRASYGPLSYGNTDLLSLTGTTFCLLPSKENEKWLQAVVI